jgi:hypothetical protein
MNHPSDSTNAPSPIPPSPPSKADYAWLQALLFPDGSALVDYGDGTLLIDEKPPYGKG